MIKEKPSKKEATMSAIDPNLDQLMGQLNDIQATIRERANDVQKSISGVEDKLRESFGTLYHIEKTLERIEEILKTISRKYS